MESEGSKMPDFANPPVIEVVFGIQFDELQEMKSPHYGFFWEKLGRTEYPECQQMPPLAPIKETYGEAFELPESFLIRNQPPLPRLFYLNSRKDRLIQLQENRLLQNWRKSEVSDKYPRFKELFPEFIKLWQLFLEFAKEQGFGNPKPNQYELTYINHILPEPESVSWRKILNLSRLRRGLFNLSA
jgi:uncharacterized protein (TIGR04255 family)